MRDNVLKLPQILPGATEECKGGYAFTFFSTAASAADPVITEAQLFHCDRVEQIPAVKNYWGVHKLAHLFQIDGLEFLPFRS